MTTTIKLRQASRIGGYAKPWVARINGEHERFGFSRDFLQAESTEHGGTWEFELEDGVYEICNRNSKGAERRSFIQVEGVTFKYIEREEVLAYLRKDGSPVVENLRKVVQDNPQDFEAKLVLADALEEDGKDHEAHDLRAEAEAIERKIADSKRAATGDRYSEILEGKFSVGDVFGGTGKKIRVVEISRQEYWDRDRLSDEDEDMAEPGWRTFATVEPVGDLPEEIEEEERAKNAFPNWLKKGEVLYEVDAEPKSYLGEGEYGRFLPVEGCPEIARCRNPYPCADEFWRKTGESTWGYLGEWNFRESRPAEEKNRKAAEDWERRNKKQQAFLSWYNNNPAVAVVTSLKVTEIWKNGSETVYEPRAGRFGPDVLVLDPGSLRGFQCFLFVRPVTEGFEVVGSWNFLDNEPRELSPDEKELIDKGVFIFDHRK